MMLTSYQVVLCARASILGVFACFYTRSVRTSMCAVGEYEDEVAPPSPVTTAEPDVESEPPDTPEPKITSTGAWGHPCVCAV